MGFSHAVLTRILLHYQQMHSAFVDLSNSPVKYRMPRRCRSAIPGLIPDLPFKMAGRVLRLTPSPFAASVAESPSGSRHSSLMTSPGCEGLCMLIFLPIAPAQIIRSIRHRFVQYSMHRVRTCTERAKQLELCHHLYFRCRQVRRFHCSYQLSVRHYNL